MATWQRAYVDQNVGVSEIWLTMFMWQLNTSAGHTSVRSEKPETVYCSGFLNMAFFLSEGLHTFSVHDHASNFSYCLPLKHIEHSLQFSARLDHKSWLTWQPTLYHYHLDMFSIHWTTCSKYSSCISIEYARLSSPPSWRKMWMKNFGICNPSSSSSVSAWRGVTSTFMHTIYSKCLTGSE